MFQISFEAYIFITSKIFNVIYIGKRSYLIVVNKINETHGTINLIKKNILFIYFFYKS